VDDTSQAGERGVAAEAELVDEHLEGAVTGTMVVPGAGRIKGPCILPGRDVEHLLRRDVEDLGIGIDEPANQPGTRDAVGLGAGAGNPLHDGSRPSISARRRYS
jgi:hypothetical protein